MAEADELKQVSEALTGVFAETSNFIVIGLTGRTGSGCSTAANILANPALNLPEAGDSYFSGNEERKFKIIKRYMDSNWKPFECLQVRSVITKYLLYLTYSEFVSFITPIVEQPCETVSELLEPFRASYKNAHTRVRTYLDLKDDTIEQQKEKKEQAFELYFNWLPSFSNELREQLKVLSTSAYTTVYQTAGDNIRASGRADDSQFNPNKVFNFANVINKIIKSAKYVADKNNKRCYVVIDAIRNPYEAIYLKERYSDFHLLAVNTKNENRLAHLRSGDHKFSEDQITALDDKEYPKKLEGHKQYTSQNIQKCIEMADIHVNNPRKDLYGHSELRCQLAWYVSLMMHPGLVMPTLTESCMQLAYSVKQNSGCISRQVGAVVTDASFSVKAVGWNSSPEGQVPCLLRSAEDLLRGIDESAYSHYEKNDEKFRGVIESKFKPVIGIKPLNGRGLAFCFKDVQNEVEDEKNQVHTRSLHAEENAFLQVSKYGGTHLHGGKLFTTASPCELCAKKAYQLGIKQIVYIDPYPGIATNHVLSAGSSVPQLDLFRGAVGRAFHKLYQPLMPYKDELAMLVSIPRMKNAKEKIRDLEDENRRLKEELASRDASS